MSVTFANAWETFYSNFSSHKSIGPTDRGLWLNYIKPYFQNQPLNQINTQTIIQFTQRIEKKQLSPQAVHHCLGLIKRIYRKSKLLGLHADEIPLFITPKFDNRRIRYLTKAEADFSP
jgi:hypothetical protein